MTTTTRAIPQEIDLIEAGQTLIESELQLNELDFLEAPDKSNMASEPLSLPAALCDDLLLEEINSIPDKMGFKIGDVADLLSIILSDAPLGSKMTVTTSALAGTGW